ncbi:hypothetical protein OIO90_004768 [Microbotryomycetes sp. JL221]|nr:hypothetical protein OIO90_004768 [Microbotryomycetes sp. JL221]
MAWSTSYDESTCGRLINLAQGVPGSPPPSSLIQRLGSLTQDTSTTQYGDLKGDVGLRKAFTKDLNKVYNTQIDWDNECLITSGANLAFATVVVGLAQQGDEIILPTPWYFNNEMQLTMLGIKTVPLRCQPPQFLPDPNECRRLINDKTKAIVLVSPNNPTGAIYTNQLLKEFAQIAKEFKIALILDETYREFLPNETKPHELFENSDWKEYLIQLFSFSKSYSIPGYRLGSICCGVNFQTQLLKVLDCFQICPNRIGQQAVEWAIEGIRDWRKEITIEILKRQELFKEIINQQCQQTNWKVCVGGGYFAYVQHPFKGISSMIVAERLAKQVGLIVLPGTFFNSKFENVQDDQYLRFSIANVSQETLKLVPDRLNKLCEMWDSLS